MAKISMKCRDLRAVLLIPVFLIIGVLVLTGCKNGAPHADHTQKTTKIKAGDYLQWSVRMVDSEIARHEDSLMYGGSNQNAKWTYTTGLFLKAVLDLGEATGESGYELYAKKVIDSFVSETGEISTYRMDEYNLDKINTGKVLLRIYQKTNDDRYRKAADRLYEQLQKQPRTSEGGFWHKARYPWQMWLDGIYMSAPFYAEYAGMFDIASGFDDVVRQITLIDLHTRDPKTRLRYHAWDESHQQDWADPVTGCSPHFWGRAVGWYSMALVDVLDYLPSELESRKEILFILNDLLKAVAKYQDSSGMWYQVLDMGEEPGNYLETSCSAMFIYTCAKAVDRGYVDKKYYETAVKGYEGIISRMVTEDDAGLISLQQICSVAGLGGDPYRDGSFEYYINEPVVANDFKGVGPFVMAGIQLEKVTRNTAEQP